MKKDIAREELMAPFLQVQEQKGFMIYNHPNYNWWDQKDRELFTDIHQELLAKRILVGVEVVNSGRYNVIGHRIAEKYQLTMFGNSDEHYEIASTYKDTHRPMTLIFAKEKTPKAIQEAILDRRTVVYVDDYLIGRQKEAAAFFKASLEIRTDKMKGKFAPKLEVYITNNSHIPYEVKVKTDYIADNLPLGRLRPEALETAFFVLNPVWEYPLEIKLEVEVENILVSPDKALETELTVEISQN